MPIVTMDDYRVTLTSFSPYATIKTVDGITLDDWQAILPTIPLLFRADQLLEGDNAKTLWDIGNVAAKAGIKDISCPKFSLRFKIASVKQNIIELIYIDNTSTPAAIRRLTCSLDRGVRVG